MRAHAHDLRSEITSDWQALMDARAKPMPDPAGLDAFVHKAASDWRACGLRSEVVALLEFAEKVTQTPAKMTAADVAHLRDCGWSDRAIHDATQTIAYFAYINRVADALGVEPESDLPDWGASSKT